MKQLLEIYTDGSCTHNPGGNGGWAFIVILDNKQIFQSGGNIENTTNNRMEMMAAIDALELFKRDYYPIYNCKIYTDSKYLKNGITSWIVKWKKNGWKTFKKEPVLNQDLWVKLDLLNQQLNPIWDWVKGHYDNKWNLLVDELANQKAEDVR